MWSVMGHLQGKISIVFQIQRNLMQSSDAFKFWNNWGASSRLGTLESRAEIIKLMKMHCSCGDPSTIILPRLAPQYVDPGKLETILL